MKFLKFFFAAIFSLVMFVGAAHAEKPILSVDVKKEISKKLNSLDLSKMSGESFVINFMINTENQLVVVSTSDKRVDDSVKNMLNYMKITEHNLETNKLYTIPVRVK
jgi:hypothetical protein